MTMSDLAVPPSGLTAAKAAWKSILVHAEAGGKGGVQLDAAIALAEDLDALLMGAAAEAVEPMAYSEPLDGGRWALLETQAFDLEHRGMTAVMARNRTDFQPIVDGLELHVRKVSTSPGPTLCAESTAAAEAHALAG